MEKSFIRLVNHLEDVEGIDELAKLEKIYKNSNEEVAYIKKAIASILTIGHFPKKYDVRWDNNTRCITTKK